jgi:hypothetical protein
MEDHMNQNDGEPVLDGSAGLTEKAAMLAGVKGFVDKQLHAGFISKQAGLPPVDTPMHVEKQRTEGIHPHGGFDVECAVEGEEVYGGGGGENTAKAAGGKHGYVDHELHAGFVTKQTPLSKQ